MKMIQFRHFRYLYALLVFASCCLGLGGCAQPQPNTLRYEKEIKAFEKADQANPPSKNAILFIGSSSIRRWKSLAKDFPGRCVINRGFGGSQISDLIYYSDRIVIPYQPRLIVFYAGVNDVHDGKKPEQVLEDFKAFVAKIHQALPQARIDFISIGPSPARWKDVDAVRAANKLIADYIQTDKSLAFIDVFPSMLGPDSLPNREFYVSDKLHPDARGYEVWAKLITPYLD